MRKLDWYIGKNVLGATFIVLFSLVLLEGMFSFITQLGSMRAHYGISDALLYVTLLIPDKLYVLIPPSALIGCLIGLGNMAASSELVVMRAAGVSLWRMVWSAMKPALLLVLMGVCLGEYIAPAAEQAAETGRTIARSVEGVYTGEGIWHREGNEYMYFNAVEPNGVLYGVSIYRFNKKQQLQKTVFAKRAIFQNNHWLLENVKTTQFNGKRFISEKKPLERWDTSLTTTLLKVVVVKPDGLSMSGLNTYIKYLQKQGLDSGEYRLAFWTKALQPLSIFSLVLVGISFVFGPLRSVNMGLRIFTGVITGISFMITQSLLGPSSLVFGFSPFFAVLIPAFICIVLGGVLLQRAA